MSSNSSVWSLTPLIVVMLSGIAWYIFTAVIFGAIGITCVAWPVRAVTFCRWYHLNVGSGFAACRYGYAALDAYILSDHGTILLLGRARASMGRNYQILLKLTTE